MKDLVPAMPAAVLAAGPGWLAAGSIGAVTAATAAGVAGWLAGWWWGTSAEAGELLATLDSGPDLLVFGYAVADALQAAGLSPAGAEAVSAHPVRGGYRVTLEGAGTAASDAFAHALDEVLSPIGSPRYMVPRYVLAPRPPGRAALRAVGRAWLLGRAAPNAVVFHAVPSELGQNAAGAGTFAAAWTTWVSQARPLYTGSAEGEAVLVTHRGRSPLDVETAIRVTWD